MNYLRLSQIIEIVEAETANEVESGGGKTIRECRYNLPFATPLDSFSSISAFPVNIDSIGGASSSAGTSITSDLK